jgi:hypothetical protein
VFFWSFGPSDQDVKISDFANCVGKPSALDFAKLLLSTKIALDLSLRCVSTDNGKLGRSSSGVFNV